jgi:hypothetical protein
VRGSVDAFLIVFWIIVAGLGIIGLASTSGRLGSEVVGNVGVIFVRIFVSFSFLLSIYPGDLDDGDENRDQFPLIPSLPLSPQPGLGRLLAVTDSNTAQSLATPT